MHNGNRGYEIIRDWDTVKILVEKGEVVSVFGACIVFSPIGDVFMIKEREKPRWRFPGGGMRLETESICYGVCREVAEEAEHYIDASKLQFVVGFLSDDTNQRDGAHLRVFFSYELHHGWDYVPDRKLAELRARGFDKVESWGMFCPHFIETKEGRIRVEFGTCTTIPPHQGNICVSGFHMRALRRLMWKEQGIFDRLHRLIVPQEGVYAGA